MLRRKSHSMDSRRANRDQIFWNVCNVHAMNITNVQYFCLDRREGQKKTVSLLLILHFDVNVAAPRTADTNGVGTEVATCKYLVQITTYSVIFIFARFPYLEFVMWLIYYRNIEQAPKQLLHLVGCIQISWNEHLNTRETAARWTACSMAHGPCSYTIHSVLGTIF